MSLQDNISKLLSYGVELLPAHEKHKNPLVKNWKQAEPLDGKALWDLMNEKQTSSVCFVLGERSNGLVCLDFDTKYNPGFEVAVFDDIKNFYSDLWDKFRIEKTPSGGFHIFYKISGYKEFPRSAKIASRYSTEDELVVNPKEKEKCFLEIKGEGGLSQCWPSVGYKLIQEPKSGVGIDHLTWTEHCSIFQLLSSYNECIKEEKPAYSNSDRGLDIYSESPYDDFDKREEGKILLDNGWTYFKSNATYDYFKRPGMQGDGVSAGFSKKTGLYTIFTASADVDPKSYSPSNLKCALEFEGDKKAFYAWLVNNGYGKIKPKKEKELLEKAAKYGAPLPNNISEESKGKLSQIKEQLTSKYPYGIFWDESDGLNPWKISRENLYYVARQMGYRIYTGILVKIENGFIRKIANAYFYNDLKAYIKEGDIELLNCYESFLQNSGIFTISRLDELDTESILRSTKTVSYKFFRNGYLEIDRYGYELKPYDSIKDKLIWEDTIQPRDFVFREDYKNSIYYDYLDKAIGVSDYLYQCIGYYAHEYRDQQGYMIITTEQCEDPGDGGGSGKNVFWSLMSLTTTFKSTAASMIRKDNKLLESWNGEKIFVLSDIPKGFDLIFFKDVITDGAVVRKLYKDEYSVSVYDMCKLGGSSNYSFDDSDPGVKRRIRAIEFKDYFTLKCGIKKVYGKMFPLDWDPEDYSGFDTVMVLAIMEFLSKDGVIDKQQLTETGWAKQFNQKYTHLHDFIKICWKDWIRDGMVRNEDFKRSYEYYCAENGIKKSFSSYIVNKALHDYSEFHGYEFLPDRQIKEDGRLYRVRQFNKKPETKKIENTQDILDKDIDCWFTEKAPF